MWLREEECQKGRAVKSELVIPNATKHAEEARVLSMSLWTLTALVRQALRQALGSTLCAWLSSVAQVSGQTQWPGTTPCQQPPSDSCCCLTNLRSWEKSTESQADSQATKGQECLCATPLWLHAERLACDETWLQVEAGVKNGFYCCSRTGLIAFPSEVECLYVFVDCILLQFNSIKQRNVREEVFFGRMVYKPKWRNHDTQN